jgi:hypothetical protein
MTALRPEGLVCSCRFGGGLDADEAAVAATVLKPDVAGYEREESVVFALADVFAGLVLGAALAHENRAGVDELAAEALYAEPLSVRVAAVNGGAAAFFVCHDLLFLISSMGGSRLRAPGISLKVVAEKVRFVPSAYTVGRAEARPYILLKGAQRAAPLQRPGLQLDFADFDGGVILAMAAGDFVLIAFLEFQDLDLFGAALRNDLAADDRLGGVIASDNFLVALAGMHGQNLAECHLFPDVTRDALNADGVAGRDTVLLSPGLNHGVHHGPPGCRDKRQLYR